jgi:nitrogen PTS system EIIA component
MIDMAELITPQRTILGMRGGSKRQVLQNLAELAGDATGLDQGHILEALMQRERLGTTGLGDGIAIPHARIAELASLTGFFARLQKPIDFDALDGAPVDIVFLLLAPEAAGADHLKALARIARVLRDQQLCSSLRHAAEPDEAHEILTRRPESHGAREPSPA